MPTRPLAEPEAARFFCQNEPNSTRNLSWIITDEEIVMAENKFAPVTPDEMLILREESLAEYELSPNQLTKAVGI